MIRGVLDAISLWAIPVLLVFIPLVGLVRKVKVYDEFIEGAKEGSPLRFASSPSWSASSWRSGCFAAPARWIC
jgi:spore maturation protein SpmB